MNQEKLRWGILGAGRIAVTYIKAIAESRNGVVAAVASRSKEKAEAFARMHGVAAGYGSYEELLADPEIDAVYIALPNGMHAKWSIKAAEAGKHVLCEKPFAASSAEGRAMAEASASRGLVIAEALMYRRHPLNQKAIAMLRDGVIGDLKAVNATFFTDIDESDIARNSAELAGGALRDLGSYCVSLIRWAAGAEPENVSQCSILLPNGVDKSMTGSLQFSNGILGGFGCAFGASFSCAYEFIGTQGRLLVDRGAMCAWPGGEFKIQVWKGETYEEILIEPESHYRIMAEEFADAVLLGKPMLFPIDDAIANLVVLDTLMALNK